MKSVNILEKCVDVQNERAKEYNSADGERSMDKMVAGFNAVTGHNLTVAEGWLFMMFLKLVRGMSAPAHRDSHVDLVSYASLYGEQMLLGAAADRIATVTAEDMRPHPPFAVGQVWKTRAGEEVRVTELAESTPIKPYLYMLVERVDQQNNKASWYRLNMQGRRSETQDTDWDLTTYVRG